MELVEYLDPDGSETSTIDVQVPTLVERTIDGEHKRLKWRREVLFLSLLINNLFVVTMVCNQ